MKKLKEQFNKLVEFDRELYKLAKLGSLTDANMTRKAKEIAEIWQNIFSEQTKIIEKIILLNHKVKVHETLFNLFPQDIKKFKQ